MKYTLLILLTLVNSLLVAQPNKPQPTVFVCNYTGVRTPSIECSYDPQATSIAHAGRVVDRILKPIGLMRNFKVMECANTQNCFAAVQNGQRYIIYDAAFMQQLEDATETDWTATSVMAHEIGHHLQGHTLTTGGSTHQKELEADRFSGFVLHQLGATLDESLVAIRAIGAVYASATHPARATRLEAIQKGWAEADAIYPRTKPVTPSRLAAPATAKESSEPRKSGAESVAGIVPTLVTQRYENGQVKYKGGVLMNLRTGYGTYYYPNGDRYAGQFAYDQPHGKGTYYFADGDRFVGTFRNGKRTGFGTLFTADGDVEEEGNYVNDVVVTASSEKR
ncbi:M48 family metalloprotease [Fibrella sp. HMF5335]|uniref:M48 family metalloprotease n=1 Tax=Fibrella rubiginis TaxID=2817060 RepID=A0A939GLK7_9BACT|nr:M48 family metalloprotease [Fibrella rubiginis]MBO0938991.1 M48 family metalloprotease [Fibrella rubiginis]